MLFLSQPIVNVNRHLSNWLNLGGWRLQVIARGMRFHCLINVILAQMPIVLLDHAGVAVPKITGHDHQRHAAP